MSVIFFCRRLVLTAIFIFSLTMPQSFALQEGPRDVPPGPHEIQQLIQERHMIEERASQTFKKMSEPVEEASITVKIRGKATESNPRGVVIAEARLPKEVVENQDIETTYHKVRSGGAQSSSRRYVESPVTGIQTNSQRRLPNSSNNGTWMFIGTIGLILGGWWINRNFRLSDFRS